MGTTTCFKYSVWEVGSGSDSGCGIDREWEKKKAWFTEFAII